MIITEVALASYHRLASSCMPGALIEYQEGSRFMQMQRARRGAWESRSADVEGGAGARMHRDNTSLLALLGKWHLQSRPGPYLRYFGVASGRARSFARGAHPGRPIATPATGASQTKVPVEARSGWGASRRVGRRFHPEWGAGASVLTSQVKPGASSAPRDRHSGTAALKPLWWWRLGPWPHSTTLA